MIKAKGNPKSKSITIRFEHQEELDKFGSMLNCAPLCDAMRNVLPGYDPEPLYAAMEQAGANIHKHPGSIRDALAKEITQLETTL
jgi:hypothetical protein